MSHWLTYFRPARAGTTGWNVAKTLGQSVVFWIVFLVLGPWILITFEAAWGVPGFTFAGQTGVAVVSFVVFSLLNVASGLTMSVVGKGTPLPLDAPRELVVRGPYRYVRNPMALGGLGQGLAVGVGLGSWGVVLYVFGGGLLWHFLVRPLEEADLHRRFGRAFADYAAAVRCWGPRLRGYDPPPDDPS